MQNQPLIQTDDTTQTPIALIGVIGSGAMGRGIAQLFAQAGLTIVLHDNHEPALEAAATYLKNTFETLASKGKLTALAAQQANARIQVTAQITDLKDCDLVVEAIVENLEVKRTLFKQLEHIVRDSAILVSNTSSLSITAIAAACTKPSRVAGLHFFNPVPLMKVVEVIQAARTGPGIIDQLTQLIKKTGHTAVVCADFPGFIVNHAGRGFGTEALKIVGEGVVTGPDAFAQIDQIMREQVLLSGQGFKLGPFELMDLTALDVSHPVMESIHSQFYGEPRFRPSVITAQRLAGGLLGRKTKQGFYSYDENGKAQTPPITAALIDSFSVARTNSNIPSVWVGPGLERGKVIELIGQLGAFVSQTPTPAALDLIVLLPEGKDCTTEALELQVSAHRAIALDTWFGFGYQACKRRVIMKNPCTDPSIVEAARQLFSLDGCAVSVINDSTGFIAPRIVAMIVAIATEIAQQQIASPRDIDQAVKLGLGYPLGPFSMGNELGPRRVLGLLEDIYEVTKDPRYRPGLWLKRRALLGLDLLSVTQ